MINQITATEVDVNSSKVRSLKDINQSIQDVTEILAPPELDDEIAELPLPIHPTARETRSLSERRGMVMWTLTISAMLVILFATGNIAPKTDSPIIPTSNYLASPIRGKVSAVFVESGEVVKSGQLLLCFDSEELELRRIRLLELSEQMEADYDKALEDGNVKLIRHLTRNISVVDDELTEIVRLMEASLVYAQTDAQVADNFSPSQLIGQLFERNAPLMQLSPLAIQGSQSSLIP